MRRSLIHSQKVYSYGRWPGLNVIFIALDTLRADHMGCYGYTRNTTPHIDALAERGVLFENMIAENNVTQSSFVTMMTGKNPIAHGVVSTPLLYQCDLWSVAQGSRNRVAVGFHLGDGPAGWNTVRSGYVAVPETVFVSGRCLAVSFVGSQREHVPRSN